MFLDWILREGWMLPAWWLLVTIAGATVLPLCVRLFNALPDKGYTLARAVGMLLIAYVYWLMASFGFVANSVGGIVLAWLVVLAFCLWVYFHLGEGDFDWRAWWRENNRVVIVAEIIFIASFAFMMAYRAYQPDTGSTEKPMDLMFISSIMRSETLPPNDGWLSGYSISYYHFGYLMAAMLSMLSGISSGFGFSMTLALWFGLNSLTVFGVVYNLIRSRAFNVNRTLIDAAPSRLPPILLGIVGVFFVLWMGNLQVVLVEMPYQSRAVPAEYINYWGMDARIIDDATAQTYPDSVQLGNLTTPLDGSWGHWWWFRASRVLADYNLDNTLSGTQPIDEFPAFSFVLADAHPHVLALPFVTLAIGIALNLVLLWRRPTRYEIVFYGIFVGGLIFLNTWDGPVYLALLVGAEALRRILKSGKLEWFDWAELLIMGFIILVIAIVAYLPFLIGFRSQASGLLPNLINPTLFRRLFLMFGLQFLIVFPFLAIETWRGIRAKRMNWMLGISTSLGLLLILVTLMAMFTFVAAITPEAQLFIERFVAQYGGWNETINQVLQRRFAYSLTSLVLLIGITIIVARLFPQQADNLDQPNESVTFSPATGFALLLAGVGLSLIFVPDFVYLRDNFGVRINTIFKFYYQAWLTLGLVSAYAIYTIVLDRRVQRPAIILRGVFVSIVGGIIVLGSVYPLFAYYTRAFVETGYINNQEATLSMDGTSAMVSQDDYAAIQCLTELVNSDDVAVLEAERHAYRSNYGRVGAITGIPIVLGWNGHQGQWRGSTYSQTVGSRSSDVDRIYTDLRFDMVQPLIEQYSIDYIFYGSTERQIYGDSGEEKFAENFAVVCENGSTRIYEVTPESLILNR